MNEIKIREILEKNGFRVLQLIKRDEEHFFYNFVWFDNSHTQKVDSTDCIRVATLLQANNIDFRNCYMEFSFVDGILEQPSGVITFERI